MCDLCWAADSPGQLAVMEAGQLVILEDGMPEQGADAPGIGALASFAGLEVGGGNGNASGGGLLLANIEQGVHGASHLLLPWREIMCQVCTPCRT